MFEIPYLVIIFFVCRVSSQAIKVTFLSIFNALKEINTTGFSLDPTFTKNMLKAIGQAYETASSKGDNCILLTSPIIRKDLANLIRQNIEDLHVLAFTELPETRRINIIATIENKLLKENNK